MKATICATPSSPPGSGDWDGTGKYGSLTVDENTGEWAYSLTDTDLADLVGEYEEVFTVMVTDGHGGVDTIDITIDAGGVTPAMAEMTSAPVMAAGMNLMPDDDIMPLPLAKSGEPAGANALTLEALEGMDLSGLAMGAPQELSLDMQAAKALGLLDDDDMAGREPAARDSGGDFDRGAAAFEVMSHAGTELDPEMPALQVALQNGETGRGGRAPPRPPLTHLTRQENAKLCWRHHL